ncbi:NAD(P)-binding domain-containing protein [Paenibacillus sp. GP183]|uniref:NAD(P)-binding domain-containing protein n=1 Tax=Paenibacillus sp. GP183 TaxID=1882751 RepID=UPI00209A8ADE|nr:NAD(P)-binding domain-containing protein [Paenibacillus sp. GP183]
MEVVQELKEQELYKIITSSGDTYYSRSVICATGPFTKPFIPEIPGSSVYTGTILHSKQYKNSDMFLGNKKVIVVGGGNSAVQIAVELADIADVILATRSPIKFLPQRFLGKDIHFWLHVIGLDHSEIGKRLLMGSSSGVLDDGRYQHAVSRKQAST